MTLHYIPAEYRFTSLLTPPGYNPKADKGRGRNYESTVMYLAPHKASGRNLCPFASAGCIAGCLHTAGRGGFDPEIPAARIARTNALFEQRSAFFRELVWEVDAFTRAAGRRNLTPCFRPNGTSDLPWERMAFEDVDGIRYDSIMARFPGLQMYDYTKNPGRAITNALGAHPSNYHLTFSRSESNERACHDVLNAGGNVAVVFSTRVKSGHRAADALPESWHGYQVVDGDTDDLRFLDPRGVVVGLRAKGKARHDTSGFVVQVSR